MISYQLHFQPATGRWLEFSDPVSAIVACSPSEVLPALKELQHRVDRERLYGAGCIHYPAATGLDFSLSARTERNGNLLEFSLYRSINWLDRLPEQLPGLAPKGAALNPSAGVTLEGFDAGEHGAAVGSIKRYLQRGDSYQVNYTQRLVGDWPAGSAALFRRMVAAQPLSYASYLVADDRAICSVSPELFFSLQGNQIRCKPMKGTAARGRFHSEDQVAGERLLASDKDRAENLMIVDMVRNDLGRVARTGSVKVEQLFALEKYPTVWQLTSTISAETDASLAELFAALFPCASIVGAPKRRTMEIIEELERDSRGIYTGAIGWLLPDRQAQFNVAIRTATLSQDGHIRYGVGGGIVWDSDPAQEIQECLDKARVLADAEPLPGQLIETLRWSLDQGYWLLEEHLQRLGDSADYFSFRFNRKRVEQSLQAIIAGFRGVTQRVRVGLGTNGDLTITHEPLVLSEQPVRVAVYPRPLSAVNRLRFHKTDPRPWLASVPLSAEAGLDDWLFMNDRGEMTESTIANVVVKHRGKWLTPGLESGLLPGTYRRHLIETGVIAEGSVSRLMLESADEIALINSVRGWRSAILVTNS